MASGQPTFTTTDKASELMQLGHIMNIMGQHATILADNPAYCTLLHDYLQLYVDAAREEKK